MLRYHLIVRCLSREEVKLRQLKLMAKAKDEFSPHGLRSFFRLLDEDGSHDLTPAEVQKGLVILGFEVSGRGDRPLS